jgi:hypothetical protein
MGGPGVCVDGRQSRFTTLANCWKGANDCRWSTAVTLSLSPLAFAELLFLAILLTLDNLFHLGILVLAIASVLLPGTRHKLYYPCCCPYSRLTPPPAPSPSTSLPHIPPPPALLRIPTKHPSPNTSPQTSQTKTKPKTKNRASDVREARQHPVRGEVRVRVRGRVHDEPDGERPLQQRAALGDGGLGDGRAHAPRHRRPAALLGGGWNKL